MFKIINCCLIFLLLFTNLFAQSNIEVNDSTHTVSETNTSEYKLHFNPFYKTNKLFLGQKDFKIYNEELPVLPQLNETNFGSNNISQLKMQINDYLLKRKSLLPNYDLGEFGKYLGYANAIGAILLAIAHISKYGFK